MQFKDKKTGLELKNTFRTEPACGGQRKPRFMAISCLVEWIALAQLLQDGSFLILTVKQVSIK
jgi:hypothetical protein